MVWIVSCWYNKVNNQWDDKEQARGMGVVDLLKRSNSLRIKLTLGVLIMTLPLIGMLFYNNFYAIEVVREQVAQSYKNTLTHSMNQIDNDLNNIDAYMNTIGGTSSAYLSTLNLAESDDDEYYMDKANLFNKLVNDYTLFHSLDSFFVYVEQRDEYMAVHSNSLSYDELDLIQLYVTDLIHRSPIPKGTNTIRWQYAQIGDGHYLIDIVQSGNAYLGAVVKSDQLFSSLQSLALGVGGNVLIANDRNEAITSMGFVEERGIVLHNEMKDYYLSGNKDKYMVIGAESMRGAFQLYALISDKSILNNLPYLQRFIWVITLLTLIFIPIGFYYMNRAFLVPLGRILLAMKKVRGGDWSTRAELMKSSNEFRILGYSFNSMMDEIQILRVNVYDEQINKQREELQRLQLQINPHFFLNSLNIVYNMAKTKNYSLIMEMTMALISYFRYLFRSNTSFVRLDDELEHASNYLNIQHLRFPGKLTWKIESPDYLAEIPVPPLIIQSFIENSIKHAMTMDESVDIAVRISYVDESGSRISIQIQDTGGGFSENILQDLQAGKSVENERGERTGIWNVQRRLKLLYQEAASIYFDNHKGNGGANVVIILPIDLMKEETS